PMSTGFGLAIVKRIVGQHHGAVVLNNRSEGGLKFSSVFPTGKPGGLRSGSNRLAYRQPAII
ncbi:hypothetical protein ACT691_00190, partial [Vibrio metschnikovii]